jgi:hypothetical protein
MTFYDYDRKTGLDYTAFRSSVQVTAADWNDAVKLAYQYKPAGRYSYQRVTEVRSLGSVVL